jgi:hypothetical protein
MTYGLFGSGPSVVYSAYLYQSVRGTGPLLFSRNPYLKSARIIHELSELQQQSVDIPFERFRLFNDIAQNK